MRKLFLIAASILFFASPVKAEGFSYRLAPPHYEKLSIKARTYDDALGAILKNGYTPFALATCWYRIYFEPPKFKYSVSHDKVAVELTSLSFLIPTEILLPSLDEEQLESDRDRKKWRYFSEVLKKHEDFHREILAHEKTVVLYRKVFENNRKLTFDLPRCLSLTNDAVEELIRERLMAEIGEPTQALKGYQQRFDDLCQKSVSPFPADFNKEKFFESL
ncbi:MAG TPA: hypothetical protein DD435_08855 [Cyanobacteria bacterium UBA8530]|nr:hypothetical protein [Cyanobacteria bacterium UBA8530]